MLSVRWYNCVFLSQMLLYVWYCVNIFFCLIALVVSLFRRQRYLLPTPTCTYPSWPQGGTLRERIPDLKHFLLLQLKGEAEHSSLIMSCLFRDIVHSRCGRLHNVSWCNMGDPWWWWGCAVSEFSTFILTGSSVSVKRWLGALSMS